MRHRVFYFKHHPSKHFLFSKTSSRRLEDVFSVTLFIFQDVFKSYSQYVFLKRLQDVFKTFSRRLQDVFQDVFKTSSRRLQDVFARRLAIMSSRRLHNVFKTSWKAKKYYTEDVFKTSSRRLQYVFTKTNVCWDRMHYPIQYVLTTI